MQQLADAHTALAEAVRLLGLIGVPYEIVLVVAALALAAVGLAPRLAPHRRRALAAMALLLALGEAALVAFHWRLYQVAVVVDPATQSITGRVAVPLWVESEKLFVWALVLAALAAVLKRHAEELHPGLCVGVAILVLGAAFQGRPFTEPLPGFLGQYTGYLTAMRASPAAAQAAFQGMEGARQFYYNTWYMWVHPPLLFLSYGAFAVSFVATVRTWLTRYSAYETTAYRWARLGYLPLTFGMLLGFPWAILAWSGESWWWSGKVNMSIMMWLLYTAYLHGRLYLRRKGMWRLVLALSLLSFLVLVLTYVTTYIVPGAHSYA